MKLYEKPDRLKYTDIAIWIDNNAYRDDCDKEKLFEYIYYLSIMLAKKAKLFGDRVWYYEDFSIYLTISVFERFHNKKQYKLKEDGTPKMQKIKSVLNYMKTVLYPRKVAYEQKYYSQLFINLEDQPEEYSLHYSFADKLSEAVDSLDRIEFDASIDNVGSYVKQLLKHTPYYGNKKEFKALYMSCMLTFLNSVTLPINYDYNAVSKPDKINKMIKRINEDPVILFHLDESMHDYVLVLTRRVKKLIANDLSYTLHTYVPSNSALTAITLSEINNIPYNYGDE